MKKLLIISIVLLSVNINAQSFEEAYETTRVLPRYQNLNSTTNAEMLSLNGNPNEWSKIMGIFYQFDDIQLEKMGIEGSVFLFDNWDNNGFIEVGNKRYSISKINFHIERDEFMSKIEGDSIYIFNNLDIDRIYVKGKQYKRFYDISDESKNKFYEVIHEGKNFHLLKGYSIDFIEASPNPMVNRSKSKIKHKKNYFISKNSTISLIKLKEKSILSLVNIEYVELLKKYVKSNNLSYKKEDDIDKMLNYITSL